MKKRTNKRLILLISLTLIGFGIYLTAENAITFMNGFNMAEASPIRETLPVKDLGHKNENAHIDEKMDDSQALYPEKPKVGEDMGELIIPTLDATLPIIHGTNEDELEKGVGHFAGSVLPGENDNSVLAGHRDTVFRKLDEVGVDEELIVITDAGTFTYKVSEVRIVDSDDRAVIVPMPKATLTVITCYPFRFFGSAPQRYVLVADLIKKEL